MAILNEIQTSPATSGLGLFVDNVDLQMASPQTIAGIRELIFEHGVVFFRGQTLAPADQIRVAKSLGEIVINRFFTPVDGHPEIAEVIKEADQEWAIGENWHTDHSYDEAPALGSFLYALETPPTGGDTCFAGMQAAYDALPEELRQRIAGLQARHESEHIFSPSESTRMEEASERSDGDYIARATQYPEAIHPIVLEHPETGRKGLYVNPEFTTEIIGLSREESDDLLQQLYDHILQPQFLYHFKWAPGSIAIWDNRATWHKAMNDYQGHRRHMRRITLAGVSLNSH